MMAVPRSAAAPPTSTQRVLAALRLSITDRVPLFLPLTMHGALELGVPVGKYLQSAPLVAQGQLRLLAKYRGDVVYPFFYGAVEHEAFGGEVLFADDGPPTSQGPLLAGRAAIRSFTPPTVNDSPTLMRVLETIATLSRHVRGRAPILGVVMSPFSLPVMQLGFEGYFELLQDDPFTAGALLARNRSFTIEWANAQLRAGADAIVYFDPVCSPTVLPPDLFQRVGLPLMRATMAAITGPCVALFASGRSLDLVGHLSGTPAVAVSADDTDLREFRARAAGRLAVLGGLDGMQMRNWTGHQARMAVRDALRAAGPAGGFILSDTCGEIPVQVPEAVLLAIRAAVDEFGTYHPERVIG